MIFLIYVMTKIHLANCEVEHSRWRIVAAFRSHAEATVGTIGIGRTREDVFGRDEPVPGHSLGLDFPVKDERERPAEVLVEDVEGLVG